MGAVWGESLSRGEKRIELAPYNMSYVLADLDFGMERIFTNYSGDISGRFLELTSLNSSRDNPQPAILRELLEKIPALQKADGHFGADIDWNQPIDFAVDFTKAKMMPAMWGKAVSEGYVNPAGGVLEKFAITGWKQDEGCSEADWLRLNLMLWRHLGKIQYLDMAERLLWTQYLANQFPNGGYGHRYMSIDPRGVYALGKPCRECPWCCSFHGPLGLRELKSYLAVGGSAGIYFNFPVEFKTRVQVGKDAWIITSKALSAEDHIPVRCEVTVSGPGSVPLMVRFPDWADEVVIKSANKMVPAVEADGYLHTSPIAAGDKLEIAFHARPYLETRRGVRVAIPAKLPANMEEVVVRQGPGILLNATSGDIENVTLHVNTNGAIELPKEASAKLTSWVKLQDSNLPHAFLFNVTLKAG